MAHFYRGSKNSLLRHLGIMHGFVAGEGLDAVSVMTLEAGREAIKEMIEEHPETETDTEEIYRAMTEAGLHQNMKAILNHVQQITIPDDFNTEWEIRWERCKEDDCDGEHCRITNDRLNVDIYDVVDDFSDALKLCRGMFKEKYMTRHEAAWILQKVISRMPLEQEDDEPLAAN